MFSFLNQRTKNATYGRIEKKTSEEPDQLPSLKRECAVGLPERYGQRVKWATQRIQASREGRIALQPEANPSCGNASLHCGSRAQQFGDHYKSRPASSTSRAFGNTATPHVPESRENLLYLSTWGRLMGAGFRGAPYTILSCWTVAIPGRARARKRQNRNPDTWKWGA